MSHTSMNEEMNYEISIRRATLADSQTLLEVWQQSVRATHAFLAEADIQSMVPQVAQYLGSDAELWVVCDPTSGVVGFMGLSERIHGSRTRSRVNWYRLLR